MTKIFRVNPAGDLTGMIFPSVKAARQHIAELEDGTYTITQEVEDVTKSTPDPTSKLSFATKRPRGLAAAQPAATKKA